MKADDTLELRPKTAHLSKSSGYGSAIESSSKKVNYILLEHPQVSSCDIFAATTTDTTFDPSETTRLVRESQIKQQINSYRTLCRNWDSYGADPPSEIAISQALRTLEVFSGLGLLPVSVSPSRDEGIVFEFLVDGKTHLIEFYNDGDMVYVRRDDDQSFVSDIKIDDIPRLSKEVIGWL